MSIALWMESQLHLKQQSELPLLDGGVLEREFPHKDEEFWNLIKRGHISLNRE